MKRIGLLSDTHAWWDDRYIRYFESCDEIWHAGDIGSLEVARRLEVRTIYPKNQRFTIEGADVWITHIGGYPGKYDTAVVPEIFRNPPDLFVSGHSHILKVMYDKKLQLLHINPGAAGKYGFHKQRTLVRFSVEEGRFKDLEVIELADDQR